MYVSAPFFHELKFNTNFKTNNILFDIVDTKIVFKYTRYEKLDY